MRCHHAIPLEGVVTSQCGLEAVDTAIDDCYYAYAD